MKKTSKSFLVFTAVSTIITFIVGISAMTAFALSLVFGSSDTNFGWIFVIACAVLPGTFVALLGTTLGWIAAFLNNRVLSVISVLVISLGSATWFFIMSAWEWMVPSVLVVALALGLWCCKKPKEALSENKEE